MKKIIALILALTLVLSLAACSGKADSKATYDGTMSELIDGIYAIYPVETMLSENTPLDLTDNDLLMYYASCSDGSKLSEAVYSEAMITIDPYIMAAIRAGEGQDVAALAQQILDNCDTRRWICVQAETAQVGVYGDVIVMVMGSNEIADGIMGAFSQVVGADLTQKLAT